MQVLTHKRILLGVTGGIAAYKAAEVVRGLVRAGAEVRVVMTEAATRFVAPLTFQALSGHPVRSDLFDPAHEAAMGHIELARWADAVLVAPASADFLARLAAGMADDLLATLCLATGAPIALAPAMNQVMWQAAATADNAARLRARGIHLFGPVAGEQACGESGPGRMQEPEALLAALAGILRPPDLEGLRVTITAGPTREPLDPVRYLSNRSSGRMGFALADAATVRGAQVRLVTGPVSLPTPFGVTRVDVTTAEEMLAAVLADPGEVFVGCAAVADYRPAAVAPNKIKKDPPALSIDLVRTPDILARVAALTERPFTVGFAAETDNLARYARRKREAKGVDLIAANRVGEGVGFDQENNALQLFWHGGERDLGSGHKRELADRLWDEIRARREAPGEKR